MYKGHPQNKFPHSFLTVGDIFRSGRCRCLPQPGTKRRGEGILRMEDAGTSEEDNDIDNQDSNTPIDPGYLAWNCSIKITNIKLVKIFKKTLDTR